MCRFFFVLFRVFILGMMKKNAANLDTRKHSGTMMDVHIYPKFGAFFLNPQHHWLVIGLYSRCFLLGLPGCIHFGWFMKQPQTFPAEKSDRHFNDPVQDLKAKKAEESQSKAKLVWRLKVCPPP